MPRSQRRNGIGDGGLDGRGVVGAVVAVPGKESSTLALLPC